MAFEVLIGSHFYRFELPTKLGIDESKRGDRGHIKTPHVFENKAVKDPKFCMVCTKSYGIYSVILAIKREEK